MNPQTPAVMQSEGPVMIDLSNTLRDTCAPQVTGPLIDHILSRYHEVHRAESAELLRLARKVETVHADDPEVPAGLAQSLGVLASEMEDHMRKEEMILFPAMRAGGGPRFEHPIAVMRGDHEDYTANIELIRQLTGGLMPPDHACGSWRALYAGTEKLLDDLAAHIALENEVLFPSFE
jgi:regulator of cell morphogenesis and NO signaling